MHRKLPAALIAAAIALTSRSLSRMDGDASGKAEATRCNDPPVPQIST